MNRLRDTLIRFMYGRYGYDDLNGTMFWAALIVELVGIFTQSSLCFLASTVLLTLVMIRGLSKNRVKRSAENRKFRSLTEVPRRVFKAFAMGRKDQEHRYFICPRCHQICRVPKGRGEVTVHCPKCGMDFTRRA